MTINSYIYFLTHYNPKFERLVIIEKLFNELVENLVNAYKQVKIGNPLDENTLMGPLIDTMAIDDYTNAINKANEEGGEILYGGDSINKDNGSYVEPTIIKVKSNLNIVKEETFAPILYVYASLNVAQTKKKKQ